VIEPGKDFVGGRHIEAICEHLEAVGRGEIRRLVITVPPRCPKSTFVSVFWPAWSWIENPGLQWLCVSHSDRLAVRDTRRMRLLVRSQWYQERWPISLARDENLKASFLNDAMGYRMASSVGAQMLGHGGDRIVLDDPMDRDQAWSDVQRETVLDEYREKISTRLNDSRTGAIIAIGQRLHQRDLLGFLIETGFDVLCIPMRYETMHPVRNTTGWRDWRTMEGELMCPERFPEESVTEIEATLGPLAASGQLQQRPSAASGGVFEAKNFRYFRRRIVDGVPSFSFDEDGKERVVSEESCLWFQAVDTAQKVTDDAAYTVCVTVAATPQPVRMMVVDVFRERLSVPEQYPALLAQRAKWPAVGFQAAEEAASGIGILQQARLDAHPMVPLKPTTSKETRASTVAMLYGQGSVYHLAGAPWLGAFEDELLGFPTGAFKDQVDSLAWAGIVLQSSRVRGLLASRELVTSPYKVEAGQEPEKGTGVAEALTGRRAPARMGAALEWGDSWT